MGPSELQQVTLIGRHSVRAPLPGEIEYAAPYVTQPWPQWDVAPSQLSEHGRRLCRNLGHWWREFYCPLLQEASAPQDWIYTRADSLQRDVDTGREWLRGMLREAADAVEVEHHPITEPTTYDPLFLPICSGMVKVEGVREAMLGRMGGSIDNAVRSIERPLELIEQVFGKTIRQPELYGGRNEILEDGTIHGTLYLAQIASDMFIMQYANGWPLYKVAWGRVDHGDLLDIARTRAFVDNLLMRAPAYSRAQASNLMAHVLAGMEQRVRGEAIEGMPFGPQKRLVAYFGHDTNVEAIGALLGISWIPRGWVQYQAPPTGQHVFELHRDREAGGWFVRMFFVSPTMLQMSSGCDLDLKMPPSRCPISLSDHQRSMTVFDVPWEVFRAGVRYRLDPSAVSPDIADWIADIPVAV